MKLLGERNWWAQARRIASKQRFGLLEAATPTTSPASRPTAVLAEPGEDINSDVDAAPVAAGSATMGR